ncbi:hypothetical protein [Accumulibacter sp.]|uniref:Uncharacterized protein n=1 Tax=Candidatus Accumulibacter proximus TaxID=2954385 RepID=A0A935Q1R3_9PROT|nr:hypothetical protein [Accumulibacter sp.]MBK7677358.1 hypothetical protein [Candidatus Accumulibacter proximus]MBL8374867.1 hypothetical protein [Accumulibacter sp.]
MKLSSVLSKTPKGLDEISTRANRLPSRVRALLIMVDGHRTGDELVALSSSSAEGKRHLAALLNGGFIQVQSPPGSSAKDLPDAHPALPDEDISLARSYAARTLMELLGAQAGALVAEIERTRTRDELLRQLVKLRAALRAAPDQKAAQQFLEKLVLVLD